MIKGLAVLAAVSLLLGWLLVRSEQARAVVEAEIVRADAVIAEQEARIEENNRITVLESGLRELLDSQRAARSDRFVGAAALITDEEWLCADSRVPDVIIDGMRRGEVAVE